ncbi:MAG: hypothetical protein L0191_05475, partial [Acidobacteria bacterium]|nr:hypothetical protein [Acidobacteriota bacterium]
MKYITLVFFVLMTISGAYSQSSTDGASSIPVIYTTDLFHPHDDPDDHFDLATIFAMPELDLKGIVLDQGDKQL